MLKFLKQILFLLFTTLTFSQNSGDNFFDITAKKESEFNYAFSTLNPSQTKAYNLLEKKHKKFKRWQWFWQHRIDKNGNFNTYNKERFSPEHIQTLRKSKITSKANDSLVNWKIIGPEKFPEGKNPKGLKGIGRIDAIITNPKNKNHVIIGARAGGIWETYNMSSPNPKWTCLTNDLPVATVNDLKIIDETLYAATSNINPILVQGDTRYGLGVIKKQLDANYWELPDKTFESKKLATSKKHPEVIYSLGQKVIYKSIDSGKNWFKLSNPVDNIETSKIFLTNIEVNPKNSDIVIITGKLSLYDITNNKKTDILIFKSEDGGKTWENLTKCLEDFLNDEFTKQQSKEKPIDITSAKQNQITTDFYNKKLFIGIQEKYDSRRLFFVTMDKKWKDFTLYNSLSKRKTLNYKTDNMDACFKVLNDSLILVGNRKLRLINNKQQTIKAVDYRYKHLHQDVRAINYNESLKRLLVGTDGGINLSSNSNNDFKFETFSNSSGNLNLFLAFNMSYINTDGNRTIRIGNQDTGYYKSENSSNNWSNWELFGGFGEGLIYTDPKNPEFVYQIKAGGHGGNLQKSIDCGETFNRTEIKCGNYVFVPLAIDENNANNLIFDNYNNYDRYTLSLSNDQLKTHIEISNGNPKLDFGMNLALAISKKQPSVFYLARKDFHLEKYGINNSIFVTKNLDFQNPKQIEFIELTENFKKTDDEILNQAFITDIEINDKNENELWVSFGNLVSGKKIYHSKDGGKNWVNISLNLPNIPVNTVEYDAENNDLYIGNDYGVYKLNTSTNNWKKYGKNLPICIVTTIAIDNKENEIIASTHGRSVWIAPLKNK